MKLNLLILCVIGLLGYGLSYMLFQSPPGTATEEALPVLKTGSPAPAFTFSTPDGKEFDLASYEGKTVVLNFWASWCTPCVREFPILIEAVQNRDDVVLIALSSDLNQDAMDKFLSKMKTVNKVEWAAKNIVIALDESQEITRDLYQTYRLPETYIIGPDQNIHHKLIGADWSAQELKALLDQTSSMVN